MNLETGIILATLSACLFGFVYSFYNFWTVAKIKMQKRKEKEKEKEKKSPRHPKEEDSVSMELIKQREHRNRTIAAQDYDNLVQAGDLISSSATVYLLQEYAVLGIFIIVFGLLLYVLRSRTE